MPSSLEKARAETAAPPKKSLRSATGTDCSDLQRRLIHQVGEALWMPGGLSHEERQQRLKAALTLLEEIKPQDGLEGMLAVQMVATHNMALDCFRRAVYGEQTPPAFEMSLRHAEKLMAAYLRQLETLDKRRGKGAPTVMVQSLNVEAGGQAVVGTVNTGPRDQHGLEAGTHAGTVAPQAVKPDAAHETPTRFGWDEV